MYVYAYLRHRVKTTTNDNDDIIPSKSLHFYVPLPLLVGVSFLMTYIAFARDKLLTNRTSARLHMWKMSPATPGLPSSGILCILVLTTEREETKVHTTLVYSNARIWSGAPNSRSVIL